MPKAAASSIQVIDRVTALLEAITTHPEPASLKFLSAERFGREPDRLRAGPDMHQNMAKSANRSYTNFFSTNH